MSIDFRADVMYGIICTFEETENGECGRLVYNDRTFLSVGMLECAGDYPAYVIGEELKKLGLRLVKAGSGEYEEGDYIVGVKLGHVEDDSAITEVHQIFDIQDVPSILRQVNSKTYLVMSWG